MPKKRILIAGGTGAIGTQLVKKLEPEFDVLILTRQKSRLNASTYYWNPNEGHIDTKAIEDIHAVINLSGANIIAKPWTEERKKVIMGSRINSTKLLCDCIRNMDSAGPQLFVNASAIGIYGNSDDKIFDESTAIPPEGDFLWEVCNQWEDALFENCPNTVHPIALRIGIVLDPLSGILTKLKPGTSLGIGVYPGNGSQILSWIHIDDLAGIMDFVLKKGMSEELPKFINATAPEPASIRQMLIKLIQAKGKKPIMLFGIPKWVLKLIFGERSIAMTSSQLVTSSTLAKMDYPFKYPLLTNAMIDLLKPN